MTIGEVQEWLNWHAWKACVPQKGTEGSNPSLSALTLIWETRVLIESVVNYYQDSKAQEGFEPNPENRDELMNRTSEVYPLSRDPIGNRLIDCLQAGDCLQRLV